MFHKRFIPLFLILLSGCGQPPPLTRLPKDGVIVAFGDSLTEGTGGTVSYPQALEKIIGRTVVNAGQRGETSAGARHRLPDTLKHHQPDLIIICTGGNDFLQRQDANKTEENLRQMVRTARQSGAAVVLIAVPRFSVFPVNHPIYASVADEFALWMEEDVLKDVLHDNALKSDQVHPNNAGYQKIGEAVAKLLQESGAL